MVAGRHKLHAWRPAEAQTAILESSPQIRSSSKGEVSSNSQHAGFPEQVLRAEDPAVGVLSPAVVGSRIGGRQPAEHLRYDAAADRTQFRPVVDELRLAPTPNNKNRPLSLS